MINIFRVWNLEEGDVNEYRDVIFDENTYYDIYEKDKRHLIKKSERKNFVQFRIYSIKSVVNVEWLNSNQEWLKTFIRDRLVLKNQKERSIEIVEEMKKSVHENDLGQLSTSFESSFSQHLSSQTISLRFELTEDDRISRFHSEDAEDAAESSNVIIQRRSKRKKSIEFGQLFAIGQASLDVTEIQIDLKEFRFSRDIESVDLNEANIVEGKRTRKLISRYSIDKCAQVVWENEEMRKFSSFYAAFMVGLVKSTYVNQSDQSD